MTSHERFANVFSRTKQLYEISDKPTVFLTIP